MDKWRNVDQAFKSIDKVKKKKEIWAKDIPFFFLLGLT